MSRSWVRLENWIDKALEVAVSDEISSMHRFQWANHVYLSGYFQNDPPREFVERRK